MNSFFKWRLPDYLLTLSRVDVSGLSFWAGSTMQMATQDFTYDTVMAVVPAVPLNHRIWTVTLGDEDWKYPFLCLCTLTEEQGWVRLGRIDIVKRSLLGLATEVQVCIIS
jgi:hypothetical protein